MIIYDGMSNNFWKNKSVLVTGAAGFVGSHLCNFLHKNGASVMGISRSKNISNSICVDITNRKKLEKIFQKIKPYACFHLASDALVEKGQEKPYETIKNNIVGSLNVLELCRLFHVPRIIIASTVHVYGDTPSPYHEDNPPRPSRPYETSKTCVDIVAQSYADTFHLPVLIPRFVNIYGPGDLHFSRIIPKTIQSILLGKRPTMWGGTAMREYLYVDDVIRAYATLTQIEDRLIEKNRIYNFGTKEDISVQQLINKIIFLCNSKLKIQKILIGRKDEISSQRVSWEKARRVLHWEPEIFLDDGLKKTIRWWTEYLFHNT